ncbi:GTPase and tRNA-U34 5-formylation enzyme TrmE [Lentilactobacillus kosonis]|uniref:GTPase and tRNA-U34 5-formylation enzyme TrmE n=1 Tax=Lentilactobacillus kosonis TaxID=2810561 RepID=A0A401FJB0_9LACO|nr:GTPase and tRNA-U34 5-formylation enzyme TrmE [Lentilactobacillus kosonis]
MTSEDRELIELTDNGQRIVVLNKTDLPIKLDLAELKQLTGNQNMISTSAIEADGLQELEELIAKMFFEEGISSSQNNVMITNARHIGLLNQANQSLDSVIQGLDQGMPVDLVQIDMTHCWDLLGEVTGDSYQDELIDQLFSQFCLGK